MRWKKGWRIIRNSNYLFTVYQYYVRLRGVEPVIWRRIQVAKCDQDRFITALFRSFGWARRATRGEPAADAEGDLLVQRTERRASGGWISIAAPACAPRLRLQPCKGNDEPWFFDAMLEGRLRLAHPRTYPCCLDGDWACPPYDFVTAADYQLFLNIVRRPAHPLRDTLLRSCGFNPRAFDANAATAAMQHSGTEGLESVEVEPSFKQSVYYRQFPPQPPWLDWLGDLRPQPDEVYDDRPNRVLEKAESHSEPGSQAIATPVEPRPAGRQSYVVEANATVAETVVAAADRSPPEPKK